MSAEQAKDYAETEFEKYRIFQDRVFLVWFRQVELQLEAIQSKIYDIRG